MCVWLGWTNGRFTLDSYITPVLPQEREISFITFPEMVILLVTHFGARPEHTVHRWEAPFRQQSNFLRKHLSICWAFVVPLHPCSFTFTHSLFAQVLLQQKKCSWACPRYTDMTQKHWRRSCACRRSHYSVFMSASVLNLQVPCHCWIIQLQSSLTVSSL